MDDMFGYFRQKARGGLGADVDLRMERIAQSTEVAVLFDPYDMGARPPHRGEELPDFTVSLLPLRPEAVPTIAIEGRATAPDAPSERTVRCVGGAPGTPTELCHQE